VREQEVVKHSHLLRWMTSAKSSVRAEPSQEATSSRQDMFSPISQIKDNEDICLRLALDAEVLRIREISVHVGCGSDLSPFAGRSRSIVARRQLMGSLNV